MGKDKPAAEALLKTLTTTLLKPTTTPAVTGDPKSKKSPKKSAK